MHVIRFSFLISISLSSLSSLIHGRILTFVARWQTLQTHGISYSSQERKTNLLQKLDEFEKKISQDEATHAVSSVDFERKDVETKPEESSLSFEQRKALLEHEYDLKFREQQLAFELKQREQAFLLEMKCKEFELEKQMLGVKKEHDSESIRVLKIRDKREDEDVEEYFQLFEKAALAMHLSEDSWVGNLSYHLNDNSRCVFLELSSEEMKTVVRNKILDAYQLTAEHYRCSTPIC